MPAAAEAGTSPWDDVVRGADPTEVRAISTLKDALAQHARS